MQRVNYSTFRTTSNLSSLLKDNEIENLRNSQNGWLSERNSLKAKTEELQTSLRAK